MVRLKGDDPRGLPRHLAISIPYGSIKRTTDEAYREVRSISIPYGSIKSHRLQQQQRQLYYFNSLWFD